MKLPTVATVDFETEPIEARPDYPPKPVGVSIMEPGQRSPTYLAWGHPTGNNTTKRDAQRVLKRVWHDHKLLFQNGKFDIDVGEVHMGLAPPPALDIHDSMFLIFLMDPHAPNLALKPSAERLLGISPEERDTLARWLVDRDPELRAAGLLPSTEKKITMANFGKWICLAPGDIVAPYANGDVTRTYKIFKHLWKQMVEAGMLTAYQREQRLMLPMLENERHGIRTDARLMERDVKMYDAAMVQAERWLRKTLKDPNLDFEKDKDVADALDKQGIVTEWTTTKTGQRSVSKKNLKAEHFENAKVASALGYRNRLHTCLSMYYKNWMRMAANGGRLYTEWNQVRQSKSGNDSKGARTGRLSASLFMNVPSDWYDKNDGYVHPAFMAGLPELPMMRRYILPDAPNHWFGRRDFNQQELRILAHFEDGALMDAYLENPKLDTHTFVQGTVSDMLGRPVQRRPIKILNFGFIYGQGAGSMADQLGMPLQEVKMLQGAQLNCLPGLKDLSKAIKQRAREDLPITTWGGRQYFCEPPAHSKKFNRMMTFEYKLLNYLIQGSAADCTKEAYLRWHEHPKREGRLVVMVHDEIDISAEKKRFKEEMLLLRECMMSVEFDVPLLSEAEYGPNWADLKDLKEPAPDLSKWSLA